LSDELFLFIKFPKAETTAACLPASVFDLASAIPYFTATIYGIIDAKDLSISANRSIVHDVSSVERFTPEHLYKFPSIPNELIALTQDGEKLFVLVHSDLLYESSSFNSFLANMKQLLHENLFQVSVRTYLRLPQYPPKQFVYSSSLIIELSPHCTSESYIFMEFKTTNSSELQRGARLNAIPEQSVNLDIIGSTWGRIKHSLIEEVDLHKSTIVSSNSSYNRNISSTITIKQKQIDEQKRIEIENADAALSINNFPDLLQTKNKENNNLKPVLNYIEKAYNNCNKGEIKRNEVNNIKNQWWNEKELPVKSEQEIAYDVLNSLCELHEKRTNEYIEKYGYDYWESTFKYNDWLENDRYWNELDDKYEKELEKEEEMEYKEYENFIKQEHLANNDRFVNYWKYY
jgi:hypothetical protein